MRCPAIDACSKPTRRTRRRFARSTGCSCEPSAGRDLAQVLAREAEIGQTPDEILEFKYRLGQVYEQRLSDLDAAIAAYREVLAAAPEHTATLEALEGLFAGGTKQPEIAEILEPLYQAAGEWEKLAAGSTRRSSVT